MIDDTLNTQAALRASLAVFNEFFCNTVRDMQYMQIRAEKAEERIKALEQQVADLTQHFNELEAIFTTRGVRGDDDE